MKKIRSAGVLTIGFIAGVVWVAACGGGSTIQQAIADAVTALTVTYDNSTSGVAYVDVQTAIDALFSTERTDDQVKALAVTAMGTNAITNDLNHDRYTDAEAVTAIKAADGAGSTIDADTVDTLHGADLVPRVGDTTITGTITATGYNFGSAKTGYVSVPGVAFIPLEMVEDTDAETDNIDAAYGYKGDAGVAVNAKGGRGSDDVGARIFTAPVYLPHNAIVTELIAYSSAALTTDLYRYKLDGSAYASMAQVVASDTPQTTISTATVDNSLYSYLLKATIPDSAKILYSVRIKYTYTSPTF